MQDLSSFLPEDLYTEHLSDICDISFTRREIDVMACLLSARKTSKIAYFLSVDPRTVETHIRNITLKLECNTREGIIDFLETSNKVPFLRAHYSSLQQKVSFEKSLKEIAKLSYKENIVRIVTNGENDSSQTSLASLLKTHLRHAGFTIATEERVSESEFLIYGLPQSLSDLPPAFIEKINQHPRAKVLLLLAEGKTKRELPKELKGFDTIRLTKDSNYYFYFFDIVKKIITNIKMDAIVLNFKETYEKINDVMKIEYSKNTLSLPKKEKHFLERVNFISPLSKRFIVVVLFFIPLIGMYFIGIYWNIESNRSNHPITLSELSIPTESVFLERPELLLEIDKGFKSPGGIQTVALVGIGGSGKTTLARQYARQQKASTIWEINAETKETLKDSFEKLAHALAKTEEDEKILRGIQEIKNPTEREEKILFFVKEHLRTQPNWLLIYDNVENFSDIQKYVPQDVKLWGRGKVVLTTRNTNIENHSQLNHSISIGELTPKQKLNLFTKIMNHGSTSSTTSKNAETITFLEKIPPFPLDVSVSAYYLKVTNISYEKYLKNLENYNNEFANVQKNLLKEAGSYIKTRYGIITLSLEQLIKSHKSFGELLLFISLLDSQNIPRDLLIKHKSDAVVDNFIYHLKKYSLITTNTSCSTADLMFSIHRSTQTITLNYLTKEMNLLKNNKLVQAICDTFTDYIVDAIEKGDFIKMKVLLTHGMAFLSHQNLLTDVMKASISGELGGIYCSQSSYTKATNTLERCCKVLDKKQNPILFAHFSIYLARLYNTLGQYEKSSRLLKENLIIYNKYSKKHKDVAKTLGYLGSIYRKTGKYKEAKVLLEESLKIYKSHFHQNHVLIPWVSINLGHLYLDQGNYEIAQNLFEESLKIYKLHYSENKIGIADVLARIGIIQRDLGEYEKAKNLLEECLYIYQGNLSENHQYFAEPLAYLGSVNLQLKNYKKAKDLLEQSLGIYKKHVFENHVFSAMALGYLGNAYAGLKSYQTAKNYLEKNLKIYEGQYGEAHLKTAYVLRDLGRVYFLENHIELAEKFFGRALRIFQKDKHPEIYTCLESLADLHLKNSEIATRKKDTKSAKNLKIQALYDLNQALEIVKTHFPADSPHRTRIEKKIEKLEQG